MVATVSVRGKRKRSLKRKLAYSAIPIILAFLSIEGVFRLSMLVRDRDTVRKQFEALAQRPAYASKPWFSREFAAATMAVDSAYYTPKGTRLVMPEDHEGPFFTLRNGIRTTVGFDRGGVPPGHRPRKLIVLGGSTTYCAEVPDRFTWSSQLQERLATIPGTRDIEVVNCGIPAIVSLEEVERLEYEIGRGNMPDFCIFFDGVNDANQGIVNGNPWGTIRETERVYSSTGLFSALKRIAAVSVAARTVYHSIVSTQRRNVAAPRPRAEVGELAHAVAEVYERNMLRAKEICDRYHIQMIVFLQPHVLSIGRSLTADEKLTAAGIRKLEVQALRVCYPLLREKLDRLRLRGILAYDISDAFDDNLEPIFVDSYHVESTGNRLIADAILKRALPVLRASSLEQAQTVKLDGRTQ